MIPFEKFPKIPRLFKEVIITEKIDGTNAQIIIYYDGNNNPVVQAASRNRLITPENDNYGFATWVEENKDELVEKLGYGRWYGEWYGSGIQRGYDLSYKWLSLFPPAHFKLEADVLQDASFNFVPILYRGDYYDGLVTEIMEQLMYNGSKAVPFYMNPEGIIMYHAASGQNYKITFDDGIGLWH